MNCFSVRYGGFWFGLFYQCYAAQQNDDVDEELEEFVLYDEETGLPAVEETPPGSLRRVHIEDRTATVTVWQTQRHGSAMDAARSPPERQYFTSLAPTLAAAALRRVLLLIFIILLPPNLTALVLISTLQKTPSLPASI